jgi:hypothetical protein
MRELPILFSGAMVRALLDGSKTQTRRVVKGFALDLLQPDNFTPEFVALPENGNSPYGFVGDHLYVRETWAQPAALDPGPTVYRSDYPACVPAGFENIPPADEVTWKPSIHMPRSLSRITLEVTGVRVERLQDIGEADAWAEGCPEDATWALDWYRSLWDNLNAARGYGWDVNPWVWVVEFARATSDNPISRLSE